jgi:DNA-binding MarR family transcriptional regulator
MTRSRDPRTVRTRIVRLLEKCERAAATLVQASEVGASDHAIAVAQRLPKHLTQLRAEVLALWTETP